VTRHTVTLFTYHRKRRELRDFTSELSAIPGLARSARPVCYASSVQIQKISLATVEELAPFVGRKTATEIADHFARQRLWPKARTQREGQKPARQQRL